MSRFITAVEREGLVSVTLREPLEMEHIGWKLFVRVEGFRRGTYWVITSWEDGQSLGRDHNTLGSACAEAEQLLLRQEVARRLGAEPTEADFVGLEMRIE